MRRMSVLAAVVLLLATSLVVAERREIVAPVGAQSLLYLVADSQRDLTRMPSRFTRIPDADEVRFGDELAAQILAGRTMTGEDQLIESHLVATGGRIARNVHRRIRMSVHYLPDPWMVNAFAIPGGHVFIGAGLLAEMTTEDQLAVLLGHEMEHVDHYHCAERLQVEAALRRVPMGELARLPIEVFQAGYSKDQELEADREGVWLAAAAGYSAAGATGLFEIFLREEGDSSDGARTPQDEAAHVAADLVTGYFRSHPLLPDRIAQIRRMIELDPSLAAVAQRPLTIRATVRKAVDAARKGDPASPAPH